MRKLLSALSVVVGLGLMLQQEMAHATWIRFLLVEHPDASQRNLEVVRQSWVTGPWIEDDPNLDDFFDSYSLSYNVTHQGLNSVTIDFDLFMNAQDPTLGIARADTGLYNLIQPGSDSATGYLRVDQLLEHVTISYVSVPDGTVGSPVPGGTAIDGVPSIYSVNERFDSIPVCYSFESDCTGARFDQFSLGLLVQVARVPEPDGISLIAAACVAVCFAGVRKRPRA